MYLWSCIEEKKSVVTWKNANKDKGHVLKERLYKEIMEDRRTNGKKIKKHIRGKKKQQKIFVY